MIVDPDWEVIDYVVLVIAIVIGVNLVDWLL